MLQSPTSWVWQWQAAWQASHATATAPAQRFQIGQVLRVAALAVAEALTLVALVGVAVPMRHLLGIPGATHLLGAVHGVVFLAYVWAVLECDPADGWFRERRVTFLLSAFVPFAGFWTARTALHRAGELAGIAASGRPGETRSTA